MNDLHPNTATCDDCGATVHLDNLTIVDRPAAVANGRWTFATAELCPECARVEFAENLTEAAERLKEDR